MGETNTFRHNRKEPSRHNTMAILPEVNLHPDTCYNGRVPPFGFATLLNGAAVPTTVVFLRNGLPWEPPPGKANASLR